MQGTFCPHISYGVIPTLSTGGIHYTTQGHKSQLEKQTQRQGKFC